MTAPERTNSIDQYPGHLAMLPFDLIPALIGLAFLAIWTMAGAIVVRER